MQTDLTLDRKLENYKNINRDSVTSKIFTYTENEKLNNILNNDDFFKKDWMYLNKIIINTLDVEKCFEQICKNIYSLIIKLEGGESTHNITYPFNELLENIKIVDDKIEIDLPKNLHHYKIGNVTKISESYYYYKLYIDKYFFHTNTHVINASIEIITYNELYQLSFCTGKSFKEYNKYPSDNYYYSADCLYLYSMKYNVRDIISSIKIKKIGIPDIHTFNLYRDDNKKNFYEESLHNNVIKIKLIPHDKYYFDNYSKEYSENEIFRINLQSIEIKYNINIDLNDIYMYTSFNNKLNYLPNGNSVVLRI